MVGPMSATQTSTHCCGWALEIEARRQAPRVDPRLVIGIGFALFAASNFMNITMTNDYAADQLFWPNVVRAVGQALCFAPLSAVATAGIEAENAGSASALFNMMRNLGGAIGKVIQKQAFILAFSDTFYTLGVALIVALLAGLLLKKSDRLDAGGAH